MYTSQIFEKVRATQRSFLMPFNIYKPLSPPKTQKLKTIPTKRRKRNGNVAVLTRQDHVKKPLVTASRQNGLSDLELLRSPYKWFDVDLLSDLVKQQMI